VTECGFGEVRRQTVPSEKEDRYRATAARLAEAHRKEDPSTQEILLVTDPQFVDVRLLEVSGSAPRSGDILPFGFAARPDLEIHFASVVVLLSPDEWKDVQAGDLNLPPGWDLSKAEKL
jgi:hypothetical protein